MAASSDPRNFFESDAAIQQRERREAKASNKFGNPVVLKSKIVAAVADPASSSSVLVAEAAGKVRRVDLETSTVTKTYQGPTTPLSSLTVGGPTNNIVYAGSWDKSIWSWDLSTGKLLRKFTGHSDFVKALLWTRISDLEVLISGGSDKKIIIWDANTGSRLHTVQDPSTTMLAVLDLVVDPAASTPDEAVVVSASSDPHIRRWRIRKDSYEQLAQIHPDVPDAERQTIQEHETSVCKLVFDGDEADLWTASTDGAAKCLARARHFTTEDEFAHGSPLRAVVPADTWVFTAGRDEDVRVWDRTSGKLHSVLVGHFDEITDLVLLNDSQGIPRRVCSVSLDGTVRTWPLAAGELDAVVKEIKEAATRPVEEEKKETNGGMTADEEAELAALMEDD